MEYKVLIEKGYIKDNAVDWEDDRNDTEGNILLDMVYTSTRQVCTEDYYHYDQDSVFQPQDIQHLMTLLSKSKNKKQYSIVQFIDEEESFGEVLTVNKI